MPEFQLLIKILPDGQMQVSGPIHDKVACLGAIELAKSVIIKHGTETAKEASPILLARALPMNGSHT